MVVTFWRDRLFFSLSLFIFIGLTLTNCGGSTTGIDSVAQAAANQAKTIENKGSDTMVNLALAWAEQYMAQHPDVRISVTGGGSGTGLAALINGTTDIANASRAIKPEEVDEAKAHGVEPVEFTVAKDAIAVVVNPTNPVSQRSTEQISAVPTVSTQLG
ncbi:MAG: substrate-binding domain-containing protein [Anaerolineae bacterium]